MCGRWRSVLHPMPRGCGTLLRALPRSRMRAVQHFTRTSHAGSTNSSGSWTRISTVDRLPLALWLLLESRTMCICSLRVTDIDDILSREQRLPRLFQGAITVARRVEGRGGDARVASTYSWGGGLGTRPRHRCP